MFTNYASKLFDALNSIKQDKIDQIHDVFVESIEQDTEIFLIGNGGSAANAIHVAGDYLKSLAISGKRLRISSPAENLCFFTAAANDIDFSEAYELLIGSRINKGDTIIFFSGSGNSTNLVKAALSANKMSIRTISITAYGGGKLSEICNIPVVADIEDMEIAEDVQLAIFHYIKQQLLKRYPIKDALKSNRYFKRVSQGEVT